MRQSALFPIGYLKDALRVSVGLALRIRAVLGCVGITKKPHRWGLGKSNGALCGIRTRDLSLRRRTLYPAELRELAKVSIRQLAWLSNPECADWVGFSSVSTFLEVSHGVSTPYNERSHALASAGTARLELL